METQLIHWADFAADRIVKEWPNRERFVLATGITPSGVVHFGNFRETITAYLVKRALILRGKEAEIIFSWDDYDTFRKVPANFPQQELLKTYLGKPIVKTPDPFGCHAHYAAHNEAQFEAELKLMGIEVRPIYQAEKYQRGDYNAHILSALESKDAIKEILNAFRTEPLKDEWLPLAMYCPQCASDQMAQLRYSQGVVGYQCGACGQTGEEPVQSSKQLKLPWRIDWPMRWMVEGVVFEPGGKDHSAAGGSFATGKIIAEKIWGIRPPTYLQYDFVSIKGRGGKMSSSKGDVVTVSDILKVYDPLMIRWLFASYKSNVDFSVSFDLDVLKTYEDFDRQEALSFDTDLTQKKVVMSRRVFELIYEGDFKSRQRVYRPPFRHLCNVLQIYQGDLEKTKRYYQQELKTPGDEASFMGRAQRAWNWITQDAPETFRFELRSSPVTSNQDYPELRKQVVSLIKERFDNFASDEQLHEELYAIIHQLQLDPKVVFTYFYQLLLGRDQGPKMASFLRIMGKDTALKLLDF